MGKDNTDIMKEDKADMNTDIMTTDSNSTKNGVNVADTRENAADTMVVRVADIMSTNTPGTNTDAADITDMSIAVNTVVMRDIIMEGTERELTHGERMCKNSRFFCKKLFTWARGWVSIQEHCSLDFEKIFFSAGLFIL